MYVIMLGSYKCNQQATVNHHAGYICKNLA